MEHQVANNPVAIFLTIMAVILITPLLSERLRLPDIVGLIVGGMLIGPYMLKLLEVDTVVEALATIGLIYLMFSAGLEVNINQFIRVRNKGIVFGLLTFLIPLVMGTVFARLTGMDWPGAILLGSALSSHTLIALPIAARLGIVTNEAVSVTVGATVFTDISAFLILAIIAGQTGGSFSGGDILLLIGLIIGVAAVVLLGLPRLGKWFFRRFSGSSIEFQFVLVELLIAAMLAEAIGMHAVVGAFLAGLAINSTLPHHSPVSARVLFMGQAFFIPVFLVYSGMITDPLAFIGGTDVLVAGLVITAIAYLAKFLAAWITARVLHYSRDEMLVAWGLSQAQAAVTLPTILIGIEIGLFPQSLFNSIMLMILFTSITSPLLVQRYGARLRSATPPLEHKPLFDRVLVPIANPDTQEHLITLASILTRAGAGVLLPLEVVREVEGQAVKKRQDLLEAEIINDPELACQPIYRIDTLVSKGILRTAIEEDASLIVLGWRGKPNLSQSIFGTVLDEVVWKALVPVLIARLNTPVYALQRVVLIIPPNSFNMATARPALEIVAAITDALNVPLQVLAAPEYETKLDDQLEHLHLERAFDITHLSSRRISEITTQIQPNDLLVVTTSGSRMLFRSSLGDFPEDLAAATPEALLVIHYA
ncbi:MAG TPA: cation:proton antiporter [Phototrophicaceae bacterium]|nr:cation:proton antiporter [Phototrophicaceae bacterium]